MSSDPRPPLQRYGAAVAAVILATVARLALDPALGDLFPFATLFLSVLVVAAYAGRGPALLATAFGAVASVLFLLPPRSGFAVRGFDNQAGLVVYLVVGVGIALLGGALRHARKRAEGHADEAVRQREQLRTTLASIGDAVLVTDAEGRVRSLNPVAESLTGWSTPEAAGQPLPSVFRILNEATRREVENPALRALREGVVVGLANHTLLIARDGTERPIDDSAAPIRDAAGRVVGSVLVFRDIGERRRAEAEAQRQGERARTILESITDAFASFDRDWRFVYLNRQAEALLGRTADDLLGRDHWEEYPETLGTEFERNYRRAMDQNVAVSFEAFYPPHDRWYEVHAYPSPDGLSSYFRDVTGRKRSEEALRRSEAQLADFFENATVGLHWVGPDGTILRANRAELELLGYDWEEYVGRPIAEFHADEAVICDILRRLQAGESLHAYPARLRCKDGSLKDVLIDSSVMWEGGEFVHTRCFTRDVTETRRAEAALRAGEERLRLAMAAGRMGTWDWDIRTGALAWSDNLEEIHGLHPGGFDGTVEGFRRLVHADDRDRLEATIARSIEEVSGYEAEFRFLRPGASVGWMLGTGKVFADEAGRPARMIGVGLDITGRKRAEEALRLSEQRFARFMEHLPGLAWIKDERGRYAYVNDAAERAFCTARADLYGRTDEEVFPPRTAAQFRGHDRRALEAGAGVQVVEVLEHEDGVIHHSLVSKFPMPGPDGESAMVGGIAIDITDRMRAEAALRDSEGRFRGLMEQAPFSIQVFAPDGRTLRVNRAWEELWGVTLEQIADYNILNDPQLGAKGVLDPIRRAFAGEPSAVPAIQYDPNETIPDRTRHRDARRWVSAVAYPLKDPAGRIREVVLVHDDITVRMRAEEALREAHRELESRVAERTADLSRANVFLRALLESIQDGIVACDAEGVLTLFNRATQEFHGLPTEPLPAGRWAEHYDLFGSDGATRLTREEIPLFRALRGERVEGVEMVIAPKQGRNRTLLAYGQAFHDDRGEKLGAVVSMHDITARKAAEAGLRKAHDELELRVAERTAELRAAKDEADAANRAKTQFLAVLSHELRTPLNPILLATSSMLDGPGEPEEIRPTLEMIRQNVNLQARLIDDLLDVMRIVQGKMPLHWEVADCHRVIDQAIRICRSEVSGHDLRLTVEAVARHHHVNADAARLQQVFWNLIKNAVKFTPEGGTITVRTRNEGGDGEDRIVIEVADTGIGIEPEILPTIWEPFQQGETTITRKFGGLGLGLAICKGVVEAHGGTLEAESPGKGRGTTFRVVLKALPEGAIEGDGRPVGDGRAVELDRPSSLRILVVEDEPATLRMMARLLRGLGHAVTTANDIASGYGAFEAGEFDLIISDIGLPDGTGLDLMRRVVALRGRIAAIALTGYGMEEDIQKSREAGFTAHMTKPIDFTKLEAMIRQVATGVRDGGPPWPLRVGP
ncbi:MAG: domain S-box [Planctomycetota bacterium]|nr:domain S-box [Planctomycetota bacterium]